MKQSRIWRVGGGILTILILAVCVCEKHKMRIPGEETNVNVLNDSDEIIWEEMYSVDGKHVIKTVPSRESGIEVYVDGERVTYNSVGLIYNPVITNDGHFGYIIEYSGDGYKVVIDGVPIFETKQLLHFLTVSETNALFAMADNAENVTRIFLIDLESKKWFHICSYAEEYVEEVTALPSNSFAWITSRIGEGAEKDYNLYYYDPVTEQKPVAYIKGSPDRLVFYTDQNEYAKGVVVDRLKADENAEFLFNSYRVMLEEKEEPFSKGNDYRGRIAWNESYRIRGLTELYQKTQDVRIREQLERAMLSVMLSRNGELGLEESEFLPSFLWCEKAYSIEEEPVSIIIDNCEILGALLYPLTEGVITEDFKGYKDIVDTAKCAYDFYETTYADGHYYLPYNYPMAYDGAKVPWNWQNSMAEVSLDLYLLTGEIKYLDKCHELIVSFRDEWVEENNRIYWHYWPQSHYSGWIPKDDVSSNTPMLESVEDELFEDTSHAAISLRFLWRYHRYVNDEYVTKKDLCQIENNMNFFCREQGFSRFISGDTEYIPLSWINPPGPWWVYLSNDIFRKFVAEGSVNVYGEWDNMGRLFANAYYYDSQKDAGMHVSRCRISIDNGKLQEDYIRMDTIEEFDLDSTGIAEYVRQYLVLYEESET